MNHKVLILLLCTLLIYTGCSSSNSEPNEEKDSVRLQLNWRDGVQFLGFYVAVERGFYEDENLDVSISALGAVSEIPTLGDRLIDGEFDFSLGAALITNAQANGLPITVFSSILQLSPNVFFARADSGVQSIGDFAGRTVAIKSEVSRNNLARLLEAQGLTLDDMIPVEANFDMTPFYDGSVEIWSGYLTDEVVRARLQGLDLITFPLYEYSIEDTAVMLFTRQSLIQEDPDLAIRFLRATLMGWEWAVENPQEAIDLMIQRYPELAEDRDFHQLSFDAYIPLVRPPGVQVGAIDCAQWLRQPKLQNLESVEGLCTEEIFEKLDKDE